MDSLLQIFNVYSKVKLTRMLEAIGSWCVPNYNHTVHECVLAIFPLMFMLIKYPNKDRSLVVSTTPV